jgi:hypothetical protein
MKTKTTYLAAEPIEGLIAFIRGQRVILDADLARVYGVSTRVLNQAVRRNLQRFPVDFVFQLAQEEADTWQRLRSQIVILKRGGHFKYLPYAFTEHGAIMAATVLNSPQAVQMSVFVVRAFVKMREVLTQNQALADKFDGLEAKLASRIDGHEKVTVLILRELINPAPPPEPPRKQTGFHVKERAARYGVKAQ